MSTPRRPLLLGAATLAAPFVAPGVARALQAERPIRLIVPVAPGGSQDVVARLSARALSDVLGAPVQVENMPGGGSNIGYSAAARAPADGHILLAGSDTLSITGALSTRLAFDPLGFAPVHRTVSVPQILVVRADDPAPDFAAWADRARTRPTPVGTPGNGSLAHLLVAQVGRATEGDWTHVPYRGGALAVNDLLAGSLSAVMINIGAVTGHVRDGRLRGLFVSPATRAAALPDVPTLTEIGLAPYTAVGWHGLVAPPGLDPAIAERLNAANRAGLRRPEILERLLPLGVEPQEEGPAPLAKAIREDAARYAEVVRRFAIRAD
ncbi:Bug family tripartite tricarboxylate transporter substrate binding protein [Roseomonas sp. CCTCC AB2023176]|uniref:Bug family tripartite tricarboxylate transporter substrate binding protein n=1 Tax=Roseomonas sp. CCTCC AB2023176 TaxID=3342640 RepID=UPI0035D5BB1C